MAASANGCSASPTSPASRPNTRSFAARRRANSRSKRKTRRRDAGGPSFTTSKTTAAHYLLSRSRGRRRGRVHLIRGRSRILTLLLREGHECRGIVELVLGNVED